MNIILSYYVFVLALVTSLSIYISVIWQKRIATLPHDPWNILPSFSDVWLNLKLFFRGYELGYMSSLLGILVFCLIALSFIEIGNIVLDRLLKGESDHENTSKSGSLSETEMLSLSFMVGSLVFSLLWFLIGNLGILNRYVALAMAFTGVAVLSGRLSRKKGSLMSQAMGCKKGVLDHWKACGIIEKFLTLFIISFLILQAFICFRGEYYSDSLFSHLALPNFYINEGKVLTYPQHIHTYMPQNTEMLVMWALLLNSEIGASLLIWGFLVFSALLIWGFIKRYTNGLSALLTVCVFLSVPLVLWFSTTIKNDFPVSVFILAHYFMMIDALNLRHSRNSSAKRLALLSGILCGGAVGHKMTALLAGMVSLLMMFVLDLYHRKKESRNCFLSPFLLSGMIVPILPWFLRTFIATGNPFYPYFNSFFGAHLVHSGHTIQESLITFAKQNYSQGWTGPLVNFVYRLLGVHIEDGHLGMPDWGPMFLFILLAPVLLRKVTSQGFRCVLLCAWLSCIGLLSRILEVRYVMGILAFAVCIPFALSFHAVTTEENAPSRSIKLVTVLVVMFSFLLNVSRIWRWYEYESAVNMALSGFSLGNYQRTLDGHNAMDNLRWVIRLTESRTSKIEGVVYLGIEYGHGLKRKYRFGLYSEPLEDYAKQFPDPILLRDYLLSQGFHHIYASPTYSKSIQDKKALETIERLLSNATLRYVSPDNIVQWYSLVRDDREISLNKQDILRFPVMFLIHAAREFRNGKARGNLSIAHQLLESAVDVPMTVMNKTVVLDLLALIYRHAGNKERAEQTYLSAVRINPHSPEPYYNLAIFYELEGKKHLVYDLIQKAIQYGGEDTLRSSQQLSKYLPPAVKKE